MLNFRNILFSNWKSTSGMYESHEAFSRTISSHDAIFQFHREEETEETHGPEKVENFY